MISFLNINFLLIIKQQKICAPFRQNYFVTFSEINMCAKLRSIVLHFGTPAVILSRNFNFHRNEQLSPQTRIVVVWACYRAHSIGFYLNFSKKQNCGQKQVSVYFWRHMRSKSSSDEICKFLVKPPHFMNKNVKDKVEKLQNVFWPYFPNLKSATYFDPPNRRWGPFFNWGAPKIVVFSGKSAVYPEYECRSNTT